MKDIDYQHEPMKQILGIILILCLGACTEPANQRKQVTYPSQIHSLKMDSIDSGILLNAMGIATTADYLILSNLNKDTIFDVFDIDSLNYLYSDLIYGQGGNDMLPFRWIRTFDNNEFYTVGLGTPTLTLVKVENRLKINQRKHIEWEKDICQNLYPLNDGKFLIQPGKKQGEWSLIDTRSEKVTDWPGFPFTDYEPKDDDMQAFLNRAVQVAVNRKAERVAFFYFKIPFMQLFDFDGQILFESFVGDTTVEPSQHLRKDNMYFTGCSYTEELIFLRYIPDKPEKGYTYFQVWDWEGNLLSLFKINTIINLFTVSRDGQTMYVVKTDNDHLYRCDLSSILQPLP